MEISFHAHDAAPPRAPTYRGKEGQVVSGVKDASRVRTFYPPLEVSPTRVLQAVYSLRPFQTLCDSAARTLQPPTLNGKFEPRRRHFELDSASCNLDKKCNSRPRELDIFVWHIIIDATPTQVRRVRLRAHRAARRACLRATPAYATPAHATPACAMPTKPPSSHRPNSHALACHLVSATAQPACLRDALRLRDTATPRTCHPVPPCDPDSAPTVLALRSRRAARMACHLSPPTPADALSPSPPPHATQKATSQTLNYQGRRPAFATA